MYELQTAEESLRRRPSAVWELPKSRHHLRVSRLHDEPDARRVGRLLPSDLLLLSTNRPSSDRIVTSKEREVSLLNRPLPPKTDISPYMSSSADLLSPASQIASPTNTAPYKVSSSVSGNSEQTELHDNRSHTSSIGASGGPDEYFGDSSTFAFVSKVQSESQQENGVHLAGKTQDRVTNVSSAQTMSIDMGLTAADMRSELPERHLADSLVDAYFSRVHPLYPFVHEGCFRVEYERMWTHVSEAPSRPSWYALLNLAFAFGCEFCDAVREEDVLATASPFVARARTLIFPYIFKGGNLELVQALLLMCHYLQGTLELNECWNLVGLMIRTAVSIGLHANPEAGSLTAVEKEVRKRVWWGCFIIDRTLSMKFGRPPSIRATDGSDIQLPLDVDDQYITDESLLPRQPACRPSMTAFFTQTIKLAHIIDNILRDLYSTNKKAPRPTGADSPVALGTNLSHVLSNAVDLDGQLQSWWQEMPGHLRHQPGVADGPDFQRQRTVMLIRWGPYACPLTLHMLIWAQISPYPHSSPTATTTHIYPPAHRRRFPPGCHDYRLSNMYICCSSDDPTDLHRVPPSLAEFAVVQPALYVSPPHP